MLTRPRQRRALFIHIPKTGGVSVTRFIQSNVPVREIAPLDHDAPMSSFDWRELGEYRFFLAHCTYPARALIGGDDAAAFTFLRDPIDRSISAFNHIASDPTHPEHATFVSDAPTVESALAHRTLARHTRNVMCQILGADADLSVCDGNSLAMHAVETVIRNTPADRHTLNRAKDRLAKLSFVGFCETLDQDCDKLASILGFVSRGNAGRHNSSEDRTRALTAHRIKRTPETERLFAERCAYDIELYEHALSLFGRASR